jgi:hypothetical protein
MKQHSIITDRLGKISIDHAYKIYMTRLRKKDAFLMLGDTAMTEWQGRSFASATCWQNGSAGLLDRPTPVPSANQEAPCCIAFCGDTGPLCSNNLCLPPGIEKQAVAMSNPEFGSMARLPRARNAGRRRQVHSSGTRLDGPRLFYRYVACD